MANRLRFPVEHPRAFELGSLYAKRDAALRELRLLRMLLRELKRRPLAETRQHRRAVSLMMRSNLRRMQHSSRLYRQIIKTKG